MQPLIVKELPLEGKVLIEASAGTGKTYTIGLIVLRLLLEKGLTIEKIVLITFTKAATAELKKNTAEKIREAYDIWKNGFKENSDLTEIVENAKKEHKQIKEANLLDAIARIDEMPVFTIHSFCERLLSEFAFETGNFEEKEVVTNLSDIKDRVIANFWRERIKDLDKTVELTPADLSKSIDAVLKHSDAEITGEKYSDEIEDDKKIKYAIAYELAIKIGDKLKEEKRKLKVMDFDDMIGNCYKAITEDKEHKLQNAVKKKYDAILVDEFQDTDKMQFDIFDYLFKDKPFFMIGDPKQAIYRFRGGDIFAYGKAREKAGKNRFSMNKNYRSEKTLLSALDIFFKNDFFKGKMGEEIDYTEVECGKPELKPIKEETDNRYKPFVIWKGNNNENKEKFNPKVKKSVISEIKRLLSTEKIEPKNIAILLDRNKDCLAYKNALAKERIFAIVRGGPVFESESAVFIRILLNAICYNNNIKCIRALLMNNFCGFEPKTIDDKIFMEWTNVIYETKKEWEKYGVMNAIDFFMAKQNLWGRIATNINGERNITNIRQIMELLNEAEIKFGRIPEKINNHFAVLCKEANESDEAEERLETDEEALKIMTIHKSKGLQFDIVFVPDISRSPRTHKFPHTYMYHKNGKQAIAYIAQSENGEKELNDREEKEELARLLYVALTRAKYRLYVAHNPCYSRSKSCLREIFDDFCISNSSPNIQIEDLDNVLKEKYEYSKKNEIEDAKRECKPLPQKKEPPWQKTSFTEISQNLEPKDYIPVLRKSEAEPPAGKRMGTLLHSIFENLDFDAKENEIQKIVENKLGGFKEFSKETEEGNCRRLWVENKVNVILNKALQKSAGKLCEIDSNNKVAELNFSMKSEKIDSKEIKKIMGEKIPDFLETKESPDKFINNAISLYINGAIDLIFLAGDCKYYILDWKSNSLNDFSNKGMEEAMMHSGYHLQYYIYAVALKRWLEQTQENFDFKKQFGGAYYIFIRGVKEEADNFDGIYFANGKEIADDIINLDNSFKEVCK